MNRQGAAFTGWMTDRDRQLFRVLLSGLPESTRAEVVDRLSRAEVDLAATPGQPAPAARPPTA
jgi:hypothetical protein